MRHVSELTTGRWPGLLAHFGIDADILTGKHGPCPACGGKDRFRFDDKDGRGTFFCSHCGAGDGFSLLGLAKGWSFRDAAREIEAVVGAISPVSRPTSAGGDPLEVCRRVWGESLRVTADDPVGRYLHRRCADVLVPSCIRFHPALVYRHDDGSMTKHPAMICRIQDANGQGVALHRTYLTAGGEKAAVSCVRKVLGKIPPSSAVRLFPATACMGVAEGMETALSAFLSFGVPTWAAVSAAGLEKWTPPAGTKHVTIFGDNDQNGTGQAAAWALAKRLIAAGLVVEVKIPDQPGDWNDVYQPGGKETQNCPMSAPS